MNSVGAPWASIGEPGSRPRLRGVQRCDVAIIGAGLTGLSTAMELLDRDPDRRIIMIEADHVAAGGSGRGTGLLGPRVGPALTVARRRYGDDVARAAYLWSTRAVRHVLDLVERLGISCDLTRGSQLVAALGDQAAADQEREADAARALGLPVTFVGRAELPAVAARYASGLRYGPAATLDPSALTGALARLGEQRGLTIFERSPVRDIRRGLLTTVAADDGEVVAEQVIVAVNGFGGTMGTTPGVLGLRVQAGVTEKLPQRALDALDGLCAEPLIEASQLSPYYRLTPDGRLVVGGGAVARGAFGSIAPAPGKLRAAVRRLSPTLARVDIESTWAGPIGMTRDGLPVVGRAPDHPRVFYAGGCNGHGLAVSIYNGAELARLIAGDAPLTGEEGPADMPWLRSRAPWVPHGRMVDRLLDRYLAQLTAKAG
ncbi:MAG TPA: FAD-binding oxidoreductase [Pseudonocardiaceae bacterium]|jgi:glycine/D-amino acid oxidase-like deaminating enzyme|nr:FAD-binding oxidoreductase [Pseudonocardiaceae bacterium]